MATPEKKPSRRGNVRTNLRDPGHHGGTEQYLIFLSHATYDKWIARVLCEKIESLGTNVKTFRDDRDIEGGERISNEIRTAMSSCQEMIVLLTPESITRDWIKIEIGMAFMAGIKIVPLLYHLPSSEIPEIIREHRGFDLNEIDQLLFEIGERSRRKEP